MARGPYRAPGRLDTASSVGPDDGHVPPPAGRPGGGPGRPSRRSPPRRRRRARPPVHLDAGHQVRASRRRSPLTVHASSPFVSSVSSARSEDALGCVQRGPCPGPSALRTTRLPRPRLHPALRTAVQSISSISGCSNPIGPSDAPPSSTGIGSAPAAARSHPTRALVQHLPQVLRSGGTVARPVMRTSVSILPRPAGPTGPKAWSGASPQSAPRPGPCLHETPRNSSSAAADLARAVRTHPPRGRARRHRCAPCPRLPCEPPRACRPS